MSSLVVEGISLEQEYSKDTGITPKDIDRLRQWLQTQPHLPKDQITDLDLILVYHRCDRSIEVSKQALDLQYTLRTLFTSFFQDRQMDETMETVFKTTLITILPTRTTNGDTVLYMRLIDTDPSKFEFSPAIRAILMVLDLWQYEEGTWPGLVLLFDLKDLKFGLVAKLDIQTIQQFVAYFPDAVLAKLKGVHFINVPPFMDILNQIMKTFMSKELLEMVVVHPVGSPAVEQLIDLAGLPKESGRGDKASAEYQEETLAKLKANSEFFANENKKRVEEALRRGKPKTITDFFGSVEGSFKQLQID